MSEGKTTVASQLKKERIMIDGASGQVVDRTGLGKKNPDAEKEMTKEQEKKLLKKRLKELEQDD